MMETPLFFKNKNYNLFGVLHEPDTPNSTLIHHSLGLVFCHPFAEEKLIAHRVMVNLARRLTKEGICCFRFDYMGHGDSDGNFEDSTIETRLSDIKCAIDFLREQTGVKRIGLLGVRLGATLAALTCANNSEIDFLILISPIVDGKPYIDQCLRSNLTTQLAVYRKIKKTREQLVKDLMDGKTVNIDGYIITKRLYFQIKCIDLMKEANNYSKKVLIIQLSNKQNSPLDKSLHELNSLYNKKVKYSRVYKVKEDLFWSESKIYNPEANNVYKIVLKILKDIY